MTASYQHRVQNKFENQTFISLNQILTRIYFNEIKIDSDYTSELNLLAPLEILILKLLP